MHTIDNTATVLTPTIKSFKRCPTNYLEAILRLSRSRSLIYRTPLNITQHTMNNTDIKQTENKVQEWHCPECNHPVYLHQVFCDKCGHKLDIDWNEKKKKQWAAWDHLVLIDTTCSIVAGSASQLLWMYSPSLSSFLGLPVRPDCSCKREQSIKLALNAMPSAAELVGTKRAKALHTMM